MNWKNKIINGIKQPGLFLDYVVRNYLTSYIKNDERYLKIRYFLYFRKRLNLRCPRTFNEKLQWLKLHDRRSEYTIMVDKVKVKEYVAKIIGEEHIIPTLGVWDNPDEINLNSLPNQFVLKCNHDSGKVYICRNKFHFDFKVAKRGLRKKLEKDFYLIGREWPYKNVHRRILAEQFMVDDNGAELTDYKFFVLMENLNSCMFLTICLQMQERIFLIWISNIWTCE